MTTISTVLRETDRHGSFQEFLICGDDPDYLLLAPHGGQVEPNTDVQATLLAERLEDSSVWGTRGIVDGGFNEAFDRWHTDGQTHSLDQFPLYMNETESSDYEIAVSFHAMGGDGIIVGGRISKDIGESIVSELEDHFPDENIRFAEEKSARSGRNPDNFVNSSGADCCIHLEQSIDIVTESPDKVVGAVEEWINSGKI